MYSLEEGHYSLSNQLLQSFPPRRRSLLLILCSALYLFPLSLLLAMRFYIHTLMLLSIYFPLFYDSNSSFEDQNQRSQIPVLRDYMLCTMNSYFLILVLILYLISLHMMNVKFLSWWKILWPSCPLWEILTLGVHCLILDAYVN